jgi:signal transduction histidine kinase
MEHPDSIEEESFLDTLKLTNMHLLKEYEEDDTEADSLTEAIEMAKAISVRVKINGMIPEAGNIRDILASAVNECSTNTKKHADGDTLTVTAEEKDGAVIFTLTGNGEPPEKDSADIGTAPESNTADSGVTSQKAIRETGGLASLRTLVENAGGTMEIKAEEAFTVIIKIPKPSP